jgi:hypothetical protein
LKSLLEYRNRWESSRKTGRHPEQERTVVKLVFKVRSLFLAGFFKPHSAARMFWRVPYNEGALVIPNDTDFAFDFWLCCNGKCSG